MLKNQNFKFSKKFRLRTAYDFQNVRLNGFKKYFGILKVHYIKSEHSYGRMGMLIYKKGINAVIRNRVKRIIRENFRFEREEFAYIDMVIVLNLNFKFLPKSVKEQDPSLIIEQFLLNDLKSIFSFLKKIKI